MSQFQYSATNAAGELIEGQLEAADFKSAIDQLLTRGMRVQSIQAIDADTAKTPQAAAPVADSGVDENANATSTAAREQDLLQQHFAGIRQQADVIAPALEAYAAELPSGGQRAEVLSLVTQIRAGSLPTPSPTTPTSSMTRQRARLACAAAASTDAAHLLQTLRTGHLATRTRNATWMYVIAYPAAVLVFSIAMFVVFSKTVLPGIRSTYGDFGTELPAFTVFVMRLGAFFENIAWPVYLLVTLVAILSVYSLARRWQRDRRDRFANVSQLTSALADFAQAKLPTVDALRLAGQTCDAPLQRACDELAKAVDHGDELAAEAFPELPTTLVYAMSQTENGAARASLLRELTTMYRASSARRISWALMLLEPAAMVLVAIAAGFVVMSVMLPLLSLITNLS